MACLEGGDPGVSVLDYPRQRGDVDLARVEARKSILTPQWDPILRARLSHLGHMPVYISTCQCTSAVKGFSIISQAINH